MLLAHLCQFYKYSCGFNEVMVGVDTVLEKLATVIDPDLKK